jgi:hypothetical protein
MLALGAFSICSLPGYAQQEVDPDHYDQPAATSAQAKAAQSQNKAVAKKHQAGDAKLASKHSQKPKSRQASASGSASASGQPTEVSDAFGLGSTK